MYNSKTTFVTVNPWKLLQVEKMQKNSKTTFVTVNHLALCRVIATFIYSKTTFVTVNPLVFKDFTFYNIVQKP